MSLSFSLSVNSFFGLPAFDWGSLMRSLNLFSKAEMTFLRFLGLFESVFATFWMLIDLMWSCEKAESSFYFIAKFEAVVVAILSLTHCRYFCFLSRWTSKLPSLAIGLAFLFWRYFLVSFPFLDVLLYFFGGTFCIILHLTWAPLSIS